MSWLAITLAASLLAAEPTAPPRVLVFQHARVIDGSGGVAQEDVALVVRDGRIAALGPTNEVPAPAGAELIDCRGKTLIPGLISDHSHIGVVSGATSGPQYYTRENVRRQLRQYAAYGVTTVTALGMNRPLFDELRAEAHAGRSPGADLFGAGQGIGVSEGFPPTALVQGSADQVFRPTTAEQTRQIVRQMAERKLDLVKIWYDDGRGKFPKMTPDVYAALIDEAHQHRLRVAAHVFALEDAKTIVKAGVDVVAHGVRDALVDDEFIQLLKERQVWYIPTIQMDEGSYVYPSAPAWLSEPFFRKGISPELAKQFDDPKWREASLASPAAAAGRQAVDTNKRNLKKLFDAGVKIGFGTDSGANPLRIPGVAEHRELALYVEAGLTPAQALHIATGRAAELLQLDDRGRLQPGRRADLVVLDGDPSDDLGALQKIQAVYRQGRREAGPIGEFQP